MGSCVVLIVIVHQTLDVVKSQDNVAVAGILEFLRAESDTHSAVRDLFRSGRRRLPGCQGESCGSRGRPRESLGMRRSSRDQLNRIGIDRVH